VFVGFGREESRIIAGMPVQPTMLCRYVDHIIVCVHTAEAPTEKEWLAHCALLEHLRDETQGLLIFSEGGGPNSAQRQQMRLALHESALPPTAIMTSSSLVQSITTSLNWFLGNRVRSFDAGDLEGALRYAAGSTPPAQREQIVQVLGVLAAQLSVRLPVPSARAPRNSSGP
jgi:hypothetical protein